MASTVTNIAVITIFPEIFESFINTSLISKAVEKQLINFELVNPRNYADPPHYKVDDEIYGGGAGMLMKPEPLAKAIESLKEKSPNAQTIYLSPAGNVFKQKTAQILSEESDLIIICGRYEGIDQRIIDQYVDQELSIGDFVCMGGETPAMCLIEAVVRLKPDVIGNPESVTDESFAIENLLEAPQYTRPPEFQGASVPEVLTSGNHQEINKWKAEQAVLKTKANRPDLLNQSKDEF